MIHSYESFADELNVFRIDNWLEHFWAGSHFSWSFLRAWFGSGRGQRRNRFSADHLFSYRSITPLRSKVNETEPRSALVCLLMQVQNFKQLCCLSSLILINGIGGSVRLRFIKAAMHCEVVSAQVVLHRRFQRQGTSWRSISTLRFLPVTKSISSFEVSTQMRASTNGLRAWFPLGQGHWLARDRPCVFMFTGVALFDNHSTLVTNQTPRSQGILDPLCRCDHKKMPLIEWHWVCEVLISCVRRTTPYL